MDSQTAEEGGAVGRRLVTIENVRKPPKENESMECQS